jgi:hypothetical protein
MAKQPRKAMRGRANFGKMRRMSEDEIARTSPPELADLPDDFWDSAVVVEPGRKQTVSLRVDKEVLD